MHDKDQKPILQQADNTPELEDLLEGIAPENTHPKTDSSAPVGKENWQHTPIIFRYSELLSTKCRRSEKRH